MCFLAFSRRVQIASNWRSSTAVLHAWYNCAIWTGQIMGATSCTGYGSYCSPMGGEELVKLPWVKKVARYFIRWSSNIFQAMSCSLSFQHRWMHQHRTSMHQVNKPAPLRRHTSLLLQISRDELLAEVTWELSNGQSRIHANDRSCCAKSCSLGQPSDLT